MDHFSQLGTIITQLREQAQHLDAQRGEHNRPLFDEHLFHCKAKLLTQCVQEAQQTFNTIIQEKKHHRLTKQRAEYLTERLYAQVAAIQRELSTTVVRRNEPKPLHTMQKSIHTLYQELTQLQEWEQRLQNMVNDKAKEIDSIAASQRQPMQQTLLALEQRLKRCQEAKVDLEKQITSRERYK